ncbi:MAG: glycosyltransferase family 4 protein [Akkermansia sp.]|nr:glycosyltransferase family 4 protein [Akkermansia sp.]
MFEFLFLGNLMVEKGVLVLLQACEALRKECPDFVCHFVGAASKDMGLDEFRNLVAERQLQNNVMVYGPLYGEDKESMLSKVGALVFPTYYHNECFPFVILEAMKAGLPVISTEEGAIPDMVLSGETGLLVARKDAAALACAMQSLMENRQLSLRMGARARERYEARFKAEHFIHSVRDLLRRA